MLNRLPSALRPPIYDTEERQRAATIWHSLSLIGILFIIGITIYWQVTDYLFETDLLLNLGAIGICALTYVLIRTKRLTFTSWFVTAILWIAITLTCLTRGGLLSPVWSYYLTLVFVAGVVINTRAALFYGLISSAMGLAFSPLQNSGYIRTLIVPASVTSQVLFLNLIIITSILIFTLRHIRQAGERSQIAENEVRDRNRELETLRRTLEERIQERSRTIEKRTAQLVAGAEVARTISIELNPENLLKSVVDLIRARFDLYYVGVFLLSEDQHYAVLHAGTGEAGQRLLANRHRLEIGGQSMIGKSIGLREARIALDVGDEAVRFNNPVLPNTRSEMALPLVARERAIGALTIQSDQSEAFSTEDIVSLQGMADLIAVALDNARLYQEAQAALTEVTSLHRSYISKSWSAFASSHSPAGQTLPMYTPAGAVKSGTLPLPNLTEMIAQGKPSIVDSTLTIPLQLRGQIIGALAFEIDTTERPLTTEELTLIETIAEQAALALENARLIEETETALTESRLLANRERTINEISEKIRRLPSVDSILSTALTELGKTLGAQKGTVRINPPTTTPEAPRV